MTSAKSTLSLGFTDFAQAEACSYPLTHRSQGQSGQGTRSPALPRPRLWLTLCCFLLICGAASALVNISDQGVSILVLDLVRTLADGRVIIDFEVNGTTATGPAQFDPGSRFSAVQSIPEQLLTTLRVGQVWRVDLDGCVDDLGSGKVSLGIDPKSIVILRDNPYGRPVREPFWEILLPGVAIRRLVLILAGWVLTIVLTIRPRRSSPDAEADPA